MSDLDLSESGIGSVMQYQTREGVALLQIDDGKANAIQPRWCDEMNRALDRTEAEDVSALIISGRTGFLSAGLDLELSPLQGEARVQALEEGAYDLWLEHSWGLPYDPDISLRARCLPRPRRR